MKFWLFFTFIGFQGILLVASRDKRKEFAKRFLESHGYSRTWFPIVTEKDFQRSLSRFQNYFGLKTTGLLTRETYKVMTEPRCGLSDTTPSHLRPSPEPKSRRFLTQGTKWTGKDVLTWNMEGLKGKLQRDETKYMGFLTDSFERWSKHSNLKFLWSAQNPDITIKFLSGFHGDPYPFFESSNSLGHAFYPLNQKRLSGDIHISYALVVKLDDISLNWFFTHSIGHSLGIEHFWNSRSVMYPYNKNFNTLDFSISKSDIEAIQSLYGRKKQILTALTTPEQTTASMMTKSSITTKKSETTTSKTIKPTTTTDITRTTTTSTITTPPATSLPTTTTTTLTTTPTTTTPTTTPATTTTTTTITTTLPTTPPATSPPTTTTTTLTTTPTTTPVTTTTKSRVTSTSSSTKVKLEERTNCPRLEITALVDYTLRKRSLVFLQNENLMMVDDKGVPYTTRRVSLIPKFGELLKCIDASSIVTLSGDEKKYLVFFSKERYFLYHLRYFRFSSGPHSIHDKDEPLKLKLPSWVKKVDAATTIDGILYVFSSRFVWKVQSQGGQQKDEESAKEIATLFPGLPNNLSAALSQKRNGKIISYFLKNDMMYLYDVRNKCVKDGYPKHWGETILGCKNVFGKVIDVKH